MWDDKNFYFACKVTDDTYANPYTGRDSGWRGDSIQIAFDPKMDNPGYGRRMWMGITPGIGEKKDPTKYKKLIFLEHVEK